MEWDVDNIMMDSHRHKRIFISKLFTSDAPDKFTGTEKGVS